jgi:hypothetical protein
MNPTLTAAAQSARIADDVEALAFERMFDAAPAPLRERLGVQVRRVGGAVLLMVPGIPSPMFNRAIGLGLQERADDAQVAQVSRNYADAGISNWWLHWNPQGAPADFADRLRSAGWTAPARVSWAKMLRGPHAAPVIETTLQVRPAQQSQVAAIASVMAQCFEMPDFMAEWLGRLQSFPQWRMYGVTDGDHVVGGGYLFVEGDSAWLGVAGIAPSHRRRGGQAALMARRIDDAAAAGARHIVTETGEPTAAGEANPSLANMKRCGFTQVASRLNLVPPH